MLLRLGKSVKLWYTAELERSAKCTGGADTEGGVEERNKGNGMKTTPRMGVL